MQEGEHGSSSLAEPGSLPMAQWQSALEPPAVVLGTAGRCSGRARAGTLECVCSLAHHDAKIKRTTSPDYVTLTPEQRRANPPRRAPCVLPHPRTGREALYGVNSGTFAVVPRGEPVPAADLDRAELEGLELPSVERELRSLLPHATGPDFALAWQWAPGDLVVWDNRCTMHCATGFDEEAYTREM